VGLNPGSSKQGYAWRAYVGWNLEVAIFLKRSMAHPLTNFHHPVVQKAQEGTFTLHVIMKASKNMK
jgi:hypothetical protein